MFLYSAHRKSWNRVLLDRDGLFIEMGMTHVNGHWDKVKAETIRLHHAPRTPKDLPSVVLPLAAKQSMIYSLGAELTNKLITYDYLSELTKWLQANSHRNVAEVIFNRLKD